MAHLYPLINSQAPGAEADPGAPIQRELVLAPNALSRHAYKYLYLGRLLVRNLRLVLGVCVPPLFTPLPHFRKTLLVFLHRALQEATTEDSQVRSVCWGTSPPIAWFQLRLRKGRPG